MVAFLMVLSTLLVLMNIKLIHSQKHTAEEASEQLEIRMAEFIEAVEKENEALYQKMLERLQEAEAKREGAEGVAEPRLQLAALPEQNPRGQIGQLARQGFSASHIAKLLDMNIGEAEVAVQLEKKRQIR